MLCSEATAAGVADVPCMLNVMAEGAPSLRYVNDTAYGGEEANRLLMAVCACDLHKHRMWTPEPL